MKINPIHLAVDYTYNHMCEQAVIGVVAALSGLEVTDHLCQFRPQYDLQLGGVQIEIKQSLSVDLGVELFKDEQQTIPSGFSLCTAPLTLFVSYNTQSSYFPGENGCMKIRLIQTKLLKRAASRAPATFHNKSGSITESAVVHYVRPWDVADDHQNFIGEFRVDVNQHGERYYDTESFHPGKNAAGYVLSLIQFIKQEQQENDNISNNSN
jgi:hypothetical protein